MAGASVGGGSSFAVTVPFDSQGVVSVASQAAAASRTGLSGASALPSAEVPFFGTSGQHFATVPSSDGAQGGSGGFQIADGLEVQVVSISRSDLIGAEAPSTPPLMSNAGVAPSGGPTSAAAGSAAQPTMVAGDLAAAQRAFSPGTGFIPPASLKTSGHESPTLASLLGDFRLAEGAGTPASSPGRAAKSPNGTAEPFAHLVGAVGGANPVPLADLTIGRDALKVLTAASASPEVRIVQAAQGSVSSLVFGDHTKVVFTTIATTNHHFGG